MGDLQHDSTPEKYAEISRCNHVHMDQNHKRNVSDIMFHVESNAMEN